MSENSNSIDIYSSRVHGFSHANLNSQYNLSGKPFLVTDKNFVEKASQIFGSKNTYVKSIFPSGILHYDENTIIFERPPTVKEITYIAKQESDISKEDTHHSYKIPIPWQVYVVSYSTVDYSVDTGVEKYVSIDSTYMFFRNSQLISQDDFLYSAPMPNFYSNGLLCNPRYENVDQTLFLKDDTFISNLVNSAYNSIWFSNFNGDLTAAANDYFYACANEYINFENSLFSNGYVDIYKNSDRKSYYCDLVYIYSFFEAWSKYSISHVLNFEWSCPSEGLFYSLDYNELEQDHLEDYFHSNFSYDSDNFEEGFPDHHEMIDIIHYSDFLDSLGGDIRKQPITLIQLLIRLKSANKNVSNFDSDFSSLYNSFV